MPGRQKPQPMTLTQKILAHHAVTLPRPWAQTGDMLRIRVDWTIASELAWNGMDRTYTLLGRPKIANPERFYLALDHTVDPVTLANDPRTLKLANLSRAFAKESGITHFYDANVTIMHTSFYRNLVQPGEVVIGADSHTSSHGGLGAFAIGLGGADVTAAMVLGETWIEVPEAIAVEYEGEPDFGIGGKDIILRTLGALGRNTVALERSVEFRGSAARNFTTDMRFTICNMTAEFGGLNGIFEADGVVADWLAHRRRGYNDERALFPRRRRRPLCRALPHRSSTSLRPRWPSRSRPTTSTMSTRSGRPDSSMARSSAPAPPPRRSWRWPGWCWRPRWPMATRRRRCPLAAASPCRAICSIQKNLEKAGIWDIYQRAGFTVDPPNCSMCLGVASRKAGKGEVWLSSQNRNFENRMGEGSLAWLASAATVAASALGMTVADPRPLLARVDRDRLARILGRKETRALPEITTAEPTMHVEAHAAERERGARQQPGDPRAGAALRRLGGYRRDHPRRVLPPDQPGGTGR